MIYADNAATTRLSDRALEAMLPWMQDAYGNPSQPYTFARRAHKAVEGARAAVAACIHAEPEEIFFTSGGTESDNWAIKGAALACKTPGSIVTSAFEHHAVLKTCEALERTWSLVHVPPTPEGIVTPLALLGNMPDDPRIVSIMLANNELGTLQPVRALGEIAHKHGAIFHTDAVQAIGHIPVDVKALQVDLLSASAHKFGGPKGVGFLYVRKGTPLLPYADGGAQESGRRAGTENVPGIVGMATALQERVDTLEDCRMYVQALADALLARLEGLPFRRNGGNAAHLPGLLSLSFPGFQGEALLHRMDLMGICISTGSACDSRRTVMSHVLRAIGLDETAAEGTIRISLDAQNTMEDVEAIGEALKKIVRHA